jgi:hypothetical protein
MEKSDWIDVVSWAMAFLSGVSVGTIWDWRLYRRGRMDGRQYAMGERARIVAWLHAQRERDGSRLARVWDYADAIERGEHESP